MVVVDLTMVACTALQALMKWWGNKPNLMMQLQSDVQYLHSDEGNIAHYLASGGEVPKRVMCNMEIAALLVKNSSNSWETAK